MEPSEALMKAGGIASRVRKEVVPNVEARRPVVEICDFVEDRIRSLGGAPAFPCNVDIDRVAAHYTSPVGDVLTIPEGTLVKVDIGVHVDGYIADTATTVCLDPSLRGLVEAAEAGLDAALKVVRAGVRASDVGAVIERAIRGRGFAPIRNLTGHRMARYLVHAGQSIPNISAGDGHALKEGDVYAIEPFSVPQNAEGLVTDGPPSNIYLFKKKRRLDGEAAKSMLRLIQSEYRTMPFASRWVLRRFPGPEGEEAFSELLRSKCLYSYPQLVEKSRAPVAQAEHTVVVTADGCLITTA
ncbi:MAG: type II methionyl aminopeptidase [Candidatus Bathyarchaeota archaeon]|nr:type II methionyl aminopeptidase [Candidatus Bathyarchaeota archaeon]